MFAYDGVCICMNARWGNGMCLCVCVSACLWICGVRAWIRPSLGLMLLPAWDRCVSASQNAGHRAHISEKDHRWPGDNLFHSRAAHCAHKYAFVRHRKQLFYTSESCLLNHQCHLLYCVRFLSRKHCLLLCRSVLETDYVIWVNFPSVCVCVIAHASLTDMTTGAFSHRQRAVQGFSHIADTFIYGRYYGIWHEWNVLTISQVEALASRGGAEDGTGWELAVCLSLYMRARVTVKALCQIMGLSRGHCLSLCRCLERTQAGLDAQLFLATLHQTLRRPIKLHAMDVCFCACVNICLDGVPVPVWAAHVRSCPVTSICT